MDYLTIARQALYQEQTKAQRIATRGDDPTPDSAATERMQSATVQPQDTRGDRDPLRLPQTRKDSDQSQPIDLTITEQTSSAPEETEAIWRHVAVLLSVVQDGCRHGYHLHIGQVAEGVIAHLQAALNPAVDPTEFDRRARLAGHTATLAVVVQMLEWRLQQLAARDQDTFHTAAELGLALAYIPPTPSTH